MTKVPSYATGWNYLENCAFPENFRIRKGTPINNNTINEWIRELQQSDEDCGYISSGDTIVIKKGDKIIVSKKYWENEYLGEQIEC